jgi:hypothetical protein
MIRSLVIAMAAGALAAAAAAAVLIHVFALGNVPAGF